MDEETKPTLKAMTKAFQKFPLPKSMPKTPAPGTPTPGTPEARFQHGGTLIAKRPTLARFGEVPELVQFTPLSKLSSSGLGGAGTNLSGQAKVLIDLAPDLEGRIIENTLGEAANVIVEIQRRR